MKQFQDLVTLAPWTFIFQICNLLILTAGVKHFLFKPVQQILAKRKEEIEASYTEAEKAEGDAQAMKEEYETRLASAKEEAAEIVKSATARANARGEELVSAARAEASRAQEQGGRRDRERTPQGCRRVEKRYFRACPGHCGPRCGEGDRSRNAQGTDRRLHQPCG